MKRNTQPRKPSLTRIWPVVASMVVIGVLHYGEYYGLSSVTAFTSYLGLTRHTVDRILLLIPITWAGYYLGFGAGRLS